MDAAERKIREPMFFNSLNLIRSFQKTRTRPDLLHVKVAFADSNNDKHHQKNLSLILVSLRLSD